MTPKIAVILFPGTNCELESMRACIRAGMTPELFRWNDDRQKLKNYDGFILPGGFSYEDRGRSGVIAAKEPIMEIVRKEAGKGKPVIGICNGAQILVESALIPELKPEHLEMSLTWNNRMKNKEILGVGFYNDWIYIRSDARKARSAFNYFGKDVIMRIPVAHGEGRYTTQDPELLNTLINNEQTLFRYCDKNGEIHEDFPVNPNGAIYNLAGVCNTTGNVLALMPHPERTEVAGQPIFDSMSAFIKGDYKVQKPTIKATKSSGVQETEKLKKKPDITITVELIITDNTERTIENAMKKNGFKDLNLKRKNYFAFEVPQAGVKNNLKEISKKIIESGEILNLNKEVPTVEIGDKIYTYDKESGLIEKEGKTSDCFKFYVTDYENFDGKNILNKLQYHFHNGEIKNVEKGVYWEAKLKKQENIQKLLDSHIFHNPHAMKLVALQ